MSTKATSTSPTAGPQLQVLDPDGQPVGDPVPLDRDAPLRIGRASNNDIVLDYPEVSRAHCVIEPSALHYWRVRDLAGRNGCYLLFPTQRRPARDRSTPQSSSHSESDLDEAFVGSGGAAELLHGYTVCIPAEPPPDDRSARRCCQLMFSDLAQTQFSRDKIWLVDYPSSETVWVRSATQPPKLIQASGQQRHMLWFLLERYRSRNRPPDGVLATYAELTARLLQQEDTPRARGHIATIADRLRDDLLDVDRKLLPSEPTVGYRLVPVPRQ